MMKTLLPSFFRPLPLKVCVCVHVYVSVWREASDREREIKIDREGELEWNGWMEQNENVPKQSTSWYERARNSCQNGYSTRMRHIRIHIILYYIKTVDGTVCIMCLCTKMLLEGVKATAMLLCLCYTNARLIVYSFAPSVHSIVFYFYFVFFFVVVVVSIIHILRVCVCCVCTENISFHIVIMCNSKCLCMCVYRSF